MTLTNEEVKQIAAMQLTPEEVMVLRLVASVGQSDVALMLEVSRQYISQVVDRATSKIKAQGLMPAERQP